MTQWGLDTLFNPAKQHMDEEKRRLQATREQIGDSSGGKRIDLESGKVTIRRAGAKPASADESEPASEPAEASATAESDALAEDGESRPE
jgi:hypothetical protein